MTCVIIYLLLVDSLWHLVYSSCLFLLLPFPLSPIPRPSSSSLLLLMERVCKLFLLFLFFSFSTFFHSYSPRLITHSHDDYYFSLPLHSSRCRINSSKRLAGSRTMRAFALKTVWTTSYVPPMES